MIEIIATNYEDAKRIEQSKADRIELISALSEGGLTPSFGLTKKVVKDIRLPVYAMIRPYSDNFIYTNKDIEIMKEDIKQFKSLGVKGVVLGVLNENNEVDTSKLESLLSVCHDLEVTFHRAIDETDVIQSINILNNYSQVTTILTSGGKGNILENIKTINSMISNSTYANILLGGGLTLDNIEFISKNIIGSCFHFGTAVRKDNEINIDKIKTIKKLLAN